MCILVHLNFACYRQLCKFDALYLRRTDVCIIVCLDFACNKYLCKVGAFYLLKK